MVTPKDLQKKEGSPWQRKILGKKKQKLTPDEEKAILEGEKIYQRGVVSIKDIISPAAFKVEPSLLVLGQKYVRTLFLVNYQ